MTAMQTIKITEAFQATLSEISALGKTPWVIINDDFAVGAYKSRADARNAKAAGSLEGKILPASEIMWEVVDLLAAAAQSLQDDFDDASSILGYEDHGHIYCPHCKTHLSNGIGVHGQEVNGKVVKHDRKEYECLACGGEFGPDIPKPEVKPETPKAEAKKPLVTNASTIERPCKRVWAIADEMKVTHPGAKRKEILEECVKQGIAYYTARTQYQQWLGIQKEMAEREAQQAAKKAVQ